MTFPPLPTPGLLEEQQTGIRQGRGFLELSAKSGRLTRSPGDDRVEVELSTHTQKRGKITPGNRPHFPVADQGAPIRSITVG